MRNYHFTEKDIEEFVKNSKKAGYGDVDHPTENHEEKFLSKLRSRTKKFIDLTPYFIKLFIVVVIVYIVLVIAWYDIKSLEHSTILQLIDKLR